MNDYLLDGTRRAHLTMLEMQFAAGAKQARPGHHDALYYKAEGSQGWLSLDYAPTITGWAAPM